MNINESLNLLKNRLDAEWLVAHILVQSRTYLQLNLNQQLTNEQKMLFLYYLKRYQQGEPLAYLIGEQAFHNIVLKVTPAVLIPRSETELLVEKCLELLPKDQSLNIADLGTGSGAIALALANARPNWKISATDYSEVALVVAKRNAELLNIKNIEFYQGDWCAALPQEKFAAIISNPPYIDKNDPELEVSVKQFEPNSALLAADNGLADLKKIAVQARDYLQEGGWLLLEHGYRQGKAVAEYLLELGYQNVETLLDLNKLPRITVAFNSLAA